MENDMREIGSEEISRLCDCLAELAEHHNRVSVNFKGCYPKQPFEETLMRFSSDIDSGSSSIAVIEAEDRVVGFCKINYGSAVGVLEYLIVSEDCRGKGYGAQLLEWALNRFDELGIHDIDGCEQVLQLLDRSPVTVENVFPAGILISIRHTAREQHAQ